MHLIYKLRTELVQKLVEVPASAVLRPVPIVLGGASLLCLAIIGLQALIQTRSDYTLRAVAFSILMLGLSLVMIATRRRWQQALLSAQSATLLKASTLAFYAACLPLVFVVYLAVWERKADSLEWYRYGFQDKQWLFGLYWIAVFGIVILPAVFRRILESTSGGHDLLDASESHVRIGSLRSLGLVAAIILLAWFMYGPPWNVDRITRSMDPHEVVHLGPLQAVNSGYLPNIGPAAQQYGPGTQVLFYSFMKIAAHPTILGFRQAQAFLQFAGYLVFLMVCSRYMSLRKLLVAVLVAMYISPFAMTPWTAEGGLRVWGWPNPFRYAGVLFLVSALTYAIEHRSTWSAKVYRAILIGSGFIWGAACWIAQENLLMGFMAVVMFLLLIWALGLIRFRDTGSIAVLLLLGFSLFWLPVAISYLSHNALDAYLRSYFLVSRQVLSGFSNQIATSEMTESPRIYNLFIFFVPVLILVCLVTLYDEHGLRRPEKKQVYLIAVICIMLSTSFGFLARSDIPHLLNTSIAFPIFAALIIFDLPDLAASSTWNRTLLRMGTVLLVLFFTINGYRTAYLDPFYDIFNRITRFTHYTDSRDLTLAGSMSFHRTGYRTLDPEYTGDIIGSPVSSVELHHELDFIGTSVGHESSVYVHSFPYFGPGFVYFLADLHPAPIALDPTTMVFNNEVRASFLEDFARNISDIDYIVTIDLGIEEVSLLRSADPTAEEIRRTFAGETYYIVGTFNGDK